jgi:hypothetical protein
LTAELWVQVEEELLRVNARFSALHGASGVRDLDLFGRAPTLAGGSTHGQRPLRPDNSAVDMLPSTGGGGTARLKLVSQVRPMWFFEGSFVYIGFATLPSTAVRTATLIQLQCMGRCPVITAFWLHLILSIDHGVY